MKRLLVLMICMVFSIGSLLAEATVVDESENAAPPKKLISIDFPDTPLSTVISVLSLKTGYKFITDSELAKKRIVLSLKDVSVDEAINALLDTYNLYYVRQGDANIYIIKSKMDTDVMTVSKVFFVNFPNAKELAPTLKSKLSKSGNIGFDEKSNSIIVTDTANNIDEIDQIIRTLDIPPLQVLLEAKIIDVKIDNSLKFGFDYSFYRTNNYYQSPLDLKNFVPGTSDPVPYSADVVFGQSLNPGLSGSGGSMKVSLLQDDMSVNAYMEALKMDSNAKILTNPRLVVVNNKEASIDIIEEVPYAQQTATAQTGVTTVSIAFKEVGIKLKVKPQINRDGTIILEVSPEQSFRTGETLSGGVPVIYTSKTSTTFKLDNGETAVIGGLVKETDTRTEYKIPLLGDIPVLGNLFKRYEKQKTRTELTVLITATIIQ